MECPLCQHKARVLDTRGRKRRRHCPQCDHIFWTSEVLLDDPSIHKPLRVSYNIEGYSVRLKPMKPLKRKKHNAKKEKEIT